jgi:hypothetical protein
MHTKSNPAIKSAVAFEDVLKGLSATLTAPDNTEDCPGFAKRK